MAPVQTAQRRAPQRLRREIGNEPTASGERREANSGNANALSPRKPSESGGRHNRQPGAAPRCTDERDDASSAAHDSGKHGRECIARDDWTADADCRLRTCSNRKFLQKQTES